MATLAPVPATGTASTGMLVGLIAAAVLMSYVDRGLLPVAGPLIKTEFGMSATGFGLAVSAFFWVYAPAQLLCGWMVDRFSAQRLFGAGVAAWGTATLLMATSGGLVSLVVWRLALGLGQSFIFPASSQMLCANCTPEERGRANGVIMAGLAIGQGAGAFVGGLIMAAFGWRVMCAVMGALTLVWLLPWRGVRLKPRADSDLSIAVTVPFAEMARQRAMWISAVAHFFNNYGFYFLIVWLPLYLVQQRGVTLTTMAALIGLTYAVQAISAVAFGELSDRIIRRGVAEHEVRKTAQVIANIVKAAATLGVGLATDLTTITVALLIAGLATGSTSGQNFAIPQTFAGPLAAGRWVGVQNFGGNCAGIIGPVITGMLIDATGNYMAAFIFASLALLFAALCWGPLLPRIQPVRWEVRS